MADIILQADELALRILSEELNRRNTYNFRKGQINERSTSKSNKICM